MSSYTPLGATPVGSLCAYLCSALPVAFVAVVTSTMYAASGAVWPAAATAAVALPVAYTAWDITSRIVVTRSQVTADDG